MTSGVYLARSYDFLRERGGKSSAAKSYTVEQIDKAISTTQQAVRDADEQIGDAVRLGGVDKLQRFNVLDQPWKADDAEWFARHPDRSHRIRLAHPGEAADVARHAAPEDCVLIMLLRQVAPGSRIKTGFFLVEALWPAPDDEAFAHAFFDLVVRGKPVGRDELLALAAVYEGAARHEN